MRHQGRVTAAFSLAIPRSLFADESLERCVRRTLEATRARTGRTLMAELDWREALKAVPVFAPTIRWEADRTALVVVDMQHATSAPGYSGHEYLRRSFPEVARYYYDRLSSVVIPNIATLLQAFRARGNRVTFLTVGSHLEDGGDFEPLRRRREEEIRESTGRGTVLAARGSDAHAILPVLAPRSGELVLNKVSRSAFTSTGIDQILRNMGLTGLIFTGVATNACVLATAESAADRGYSCAIVEDACAATSRTLHEAALLNFASLYGPILTTNEVLEKVLGAATFAEPGGVKKG
ncbi:MAG: cysteine hydrolase family protein [Armatimonadota bacterium]